MPCVLLVLFGQAEPEDAVPSQETLDILQQLDQIHSCSQSGGKAEKPMSRKYQLHSGAEETRSEGVHGCRLSCANKLLKVLFESF